MIRASWLLAEQVLLEKNSLRYSLKNTSLLKSRQSDERHIGPTSPTPAFELGAKTDDPVTMYLNDIYTIGVNLAGLPGMSVLNEETGIFEGMDGDYCRAVAAAVFGDAEAVEGVQGCRGLAGIAMGDRVFMLQFAYYSVITPEGCSAILFKSSDRWQEAAKAHGEFFGEIRPASTFVEVSRFIDGDWLVEMEAEAVVE